MAGLHLDIYFCYSFSCNILDDLFSAFSSISAVSITMSIRVATGERKGTQNW